MSKFKVGDKVKTRDGQDVEIICIDDRLTQPVLGLRREDASVGQWGENGSYYTTIERSSSDIIPLSRTVTLYPALVRTEDGYYFTPSGLFRGLDDIELAVWNSGGFEFIRLLTEYPLEVEL